MTYFSLSLTYGFTGASTRSAVSTTLWLCATRVHILSMTGVSYFSLSSYASLVNASASALSDGSNIGSFAARA